MAPSVAVRAARPPAPAEVPALHVFSKHLQFLDYDRMAEAAAAAGFDGVDLAVRPRGHVEPERVREDLPRAVAAIRKAGLRAEMMTTAVTDAADPLSEAVLQVASDQGIRHYRTGWLRHPQDGTIPESLARFGAQIQRLARLNERLGIVGSYQNHAGNYVGASIWELWTLLRDVDPQWLGVQYDIRHATVEGGLSWPQGLRLIRPQVNTLVAKDFRWEPAEGRWRVADTPIEAGMVDFPTYFGLLKGYGLVRPMSVHFEYPLGGAEHGRASITVPPEEVFRAMERDVRTLRRLWRDAAPPTSGP